MDDFNLTSSHNDIFDYNKPTPPIYNKPTLPDYYKHRVDDPNIVKIYVTYRRNVINKPFDKHILTVTVLPTTTIDDLKNYVRDRLGDNSFIVNLTPHPEMQKLSIINESKMPINLSRADPYFYKDLVLKPFDPTFNFYIADINKYDSNSHMFC